MVDLIHLESIWRTRQTQLFKEIDKHAIDWNVQMKCSCTQQIVTKGELVMCEHLIADRNKKFKKIIKKQFRDGYHISNIALGSIL